MNLEIIIIIEINANWLFIIKRFSMIDHFIIKVVIGGKYEYIIIIMKNVIFVFFLIKYSYLILLVQLLIVIIKLNVIIV